MVGQEEFITNNFAFFDAIPDRDHLTPPTSSGWLAYVCLFAGSAVVSNR